MCVAVKDTPLEPVPVWIFYWFQKEFDCWLSFTRKMNRKNVPRRSIYSIVWVAKRDECDPATQTTSKYEVQHTGAA